ncbi:MAG: HAD family hydrolase [Nitrospirae bacterium]|nr:HAD family hydrolase [Nitrospirota bacterium]
MPFALKTIAWDVDDVLNDLMQSWFEQKWLTEHPECAVHYKDITENPPAGLLNSSLESYLRSLDEFRLSSMYQQMSPVKEVMSWFVKNGSTFRHVALTAVPLIAAPASAQWVLKHFGQWIRTFHFVPSKRDGETIPQYDSDKGDFLKWIKKVDVLVDDSIANIQAAESAGVKGIMIPRPWNKRETSIVEALRELENI